MHHKEKSLLEDLVKSDGTHMLDMIKQFPVSDPLHLLEEGAMKKCLKLWLDGSKTNKKKKWSKETVAVLNEQILNWNRELPNDFNRKMRSLQYLAYWKATEFRLILLYVGIVAFKDVLPEPEYINFLRLSLAIRICSCETYVCYAKVDRYRNVASSLLNEFCKNFKIIYGKNEIVSNIHNVSHIIEDVNFFGSLTNTSRISKIFKKKNFYFEFLNFVFFQIFIQR